MKQECGRIYDPTEGKMRDFYSKHKCRRVYKPVEGKVRDFYSKHNSVVAYTNQ
jgi:hypothetical protein